MVDLDVKLQEEIMLCLGEVDRKSTPLFRGTFNQDMTSVGLDNVFDNRKTKTGSPQLPASCPVHTVKPLKEPWQMLLVNALSLVPYPQR